MDELVGRRLVHVTTSDMSLALLLGPQLRSFVEAGMDVIGVSAPGPWVDDLTSWGVRHEPLVHATRSVALSQDARAVGELYRVFRRLRPDIVHTHNPKPGIYGRAAAGLARVPVVVNTVHGLFATSEDSLLKRAIVYGLERAVSSFSDSELVQNVEDIATLNRLRVPSRKLVLLGNGVDLARFIVPSREAKIGSRRALNISEGQVVVGFVGRLVWQKGLREIFDAAKILRSSRPDVVFAIVGPLDPAKTDGLTSLDVAAAEKLGNVIFMGERRDVEILYSTFDLFVLPSHREGFPRSAMEASASAVPVIATNIRGCRQVVDDGVTGTLVPLRDGVALARAIADLANDAERRAEMGRAARRRAVAEFDDRRVVSITLEVYRKLLRDREHDLGDPV
jgi:glycosyltransferase involved in cell wall biosynthesis